MDIMDVIIDVMFVFTIVFIFYIIVLFIGFIFDKILEKIPYQERELEDSEIKKREETDVVFRYRNIPDELLADHYIDAEYHNDTGRMEDVQSKDGS